MSMLGSNAARAHFGVAIDTVKYSLRRPIPLRYKSTLRQNSKARQSNTRRSSDQSCRATRKCTGFQCSASSDQKAGKPPSVNNDIPGFELVKIPGNGSCMFQAIAQCQHYLSQGSLLSGKDLHQQGYELRRSICYKLDKHRSDIEPFIGGDFDAYINHMATEGVWGGEPELAMATKVTQRPILVYRTSSLSIFSRQLSKGSEYGVDDYQNVPPICVLFDNSHYDSLLAK